MVSIDDLDSQVKTNLAIGDLVKAKSFLFQEFYRAEIKNIVDDKDIHIFYIDYGNTEVVQKQNIFELSEDLKKKVIY